VCKTNKKCSNDIGEHENEMGNGNLGQWAMIRDKIWSLEYAKIFD